jgi:cytochrome b6-f complex iron-sulfur subunit
MAKTKIDTVAALSTATTPIDITNKVRQNAPDAPSLVLLAAQDANGKAAFHVCSSVCTHEGCHILFGGVWGTSPTPIFDEVTKVNTCPCHGSRFNLVTGEVVHGPAQRGLKTYPTSIADGVVYVDL